MTAKARAIADGNTFEFVARRWHTLRKPNWSTVHGADVIESLENDIFPLIGDLPIRLVVAPKLLDVLNKVEERGAIETAHRLRQRVSSIFVYGIAAGLCDTDRAASLGKALKKKPRATKQPSIIDGIEDQDERIAQVRAVLGNCDNERCRALTKFALRLIALTAVRPNEVHGARWDEIEGIDRGKPDAPSPAALWRIGAARMKGDEDREADKAGDHLVPLAPRQSTCSAWFGGYPATCRSCSLANVTRIDDVRERPERSSQAGGVITRATSRTASAPRSRPS